MIYPKWHAAILDQTARAVICEPVPITVRVHPDRPGLVTDPFSARAARSGMPMWTVTIYDDEVVSLHSIDPPDHPVRAGDRLHALSIAIILDGQTNVDLPHIPKLPAPSREIERPKKFALAWRS